MNAYKPQSHSTSVAAVVEFSVCMIVAGCGCPTIGCLDNAHVAVASSTATFANGDRVGVAGVDLSMDCSLVTTTGRLGCFALGNPRPNSAAPSLVVSEPLPGRLDIALSGATPSCLEVTVSSPSIGGASLFRAFQLTYKEFNLGGEFVCENRCLETDVAKPVASCK